MTHLLLPWLLLAGDYLLKTSKRAAVDSCLKGPELFLLSGASMAKMSERKSFLLGNFINENFNKWQTAEDPLRDRSYMNP